MFCALEDFFNTMRHLVVILYIFLNSFHRNNDILDGEEVKLIENGKSTPSNFYVHRIKDLEAIKELQSAINQKVSNHFRIEN